jgi:phosphoribosylformylglycinamidine synthase
MKARIFITPKKTILDPQGKAVQQALQNLGYTEVKDVRMGKYIEIELAPKSSEAAKHEVTQMCEKLLANTIIEDYRFEIQEK